jgi:hypothetical protein
MSEQHLDRDEHPLAGEVDTAGADEMSERDLDREDPPAGEVHTPVADEMSERRLDREDPPAGEVDTAAPDERSEPRLDREGHLPAGEADTTVAEEVSERHLEREDPPAGEADTTVAEEVSERHLEREDPPAGEVDTTTVARDMTQPAAPPDGQRSDSAEHPFELFSASNIEDLRRRWDALQIGFVDDPTASLQQADSLVSEVAQRVADRHARLREEFSARPDDQSDTEATRLLLRRYQAFFRSVVR